ncbi:MAG: YkgJ family cysteine cluster protein [Acidobacteria bacterium]|nr:YkgJ family cysteine cluster protein [Acidobacteriota bacterium]
MSNPRYESLDEVKKAVGYGPCKQCGACCRELIVEAQDVDAIREPRIAETCEVLDGNDPASDPLTWSWMLACGRTKPCPFLKEIPIGVYYCQIYCTRPTDCVAMVPGGEQCHQAREMAGLEPEAKGASDA